MKPCRPGSGGESLGEALRKPGAFRSALFAKCSQVWGLNLMPMNTDLEVEHLVELRVVSPPPHLRLLCFRPVAKEGGSASTLVPALSALRLSYETHSAGRSSLSLAWPHPGWQTRNLTESKIPKVKDRDVLFLAKRVKERKARENCPHLPRHTPCSLWPCPHHISCDDHLPVWTC